MIQFEFADRDPCFHTVSVRIPRSVVLSPCYCYSRPQGFLSLKSKMANLVGGHVAEEEVYQGLFSI